MKKKAFTLVEILIVVSIIAVLAIGTILLINPRTIVNRGVDAQRKADLNTFKKKLEEFYNDKGCYPKLSEVCFSGGLNGNVTNKTACIMCGKEGTSPLLSPYFEKLPCDPIYPINVYLYTINSSAGPSEKLCPKSYSVYSKLSVSQDSDGIRLGCGEGGCGPAPGYGYDFGISNPGNTVKTTASFLCLTLGGSCDNCAQPGYPTEYEGCLHNSNCRGDIYATYAECISANPGAH